MIENTSWLPDSMSDAKPLANILTVQSNYIGTLSHKYWNSLQIFHTLLQDGQQR